MAVVNLIRRLREEFTAMPGLRLTEPQVERLCAADPLTSASALRALVSAGFLRPMADGSYGRTDIFTGRRHIAPIRSRPGLTRSPWQRILCLVELENDGRGPLKDPAYSALRYATTLAVTHRARITVLQVVPPAPQPSLTAAAEMLEKSVSGEAFRELIDVHVAAGSANEALARAATEVRADLIVLGRTGNAASASWSGLPDIIRQAPCPVLIVHPSGRAAVA
jgi:nucleotide-binding universal stress UspA family protein